MEIAAVLDGSRMGAVVQGDAFDLLAQLPPETVDLVITSPPYWGLRDYEGEHNWDILSLWKAAASSAACPEYPWYREHGGLLGLEPLPEWYVSNLVAILELCKGVLKSNGSLWLNLGDTYFARWSSIRTKGRQGLNGQERLRRRTPMGGYRQEKQLLLIPARVAIALQDRKWILRNDLIWYKPNALPQPFDDRLSLAHEHFFHFVKRPKEGRARYYYDVHEAGRVPHDVQTVNASPGTNQHSATFPVQLIEPRIRSSCPSSGLVLDPFAGTGTALVVAVANGRRALGFELNPRFALAAQERLSRVTPALL